MELELAGGNQVDLGSLGLDGSLQVAGTRQLVEGSLLADLTHGLEFHLGGGSLNTAGGHHSAETTLGGSGGGGDLLGATSSDELEEGVGREDLGTVVEGHLLLSADVAVTGDENLGALVDVVLGDGPQGLGLSHGLELAGQLAVAQGGEAAGEGDGLSTERSAHGWKVVGWLVVGSGCWMKIQ
eukprot:161745_1